MKFLFIFIYFIFQFVYEFKIGQRRLRGRGDGGGRVEVGGANRRELQSRRGCRRDIRTCGKQWGCHVDPGGEVGMVLMAYNHAKSGCLLIASPTLPSPFIPQLFYSPAYSQMPRNAKEGQKKRGGLNLEKLAYSLFKPSLLKICVKELQLQEWSNPRMYIKNI